jgi:hypothetical protein
MRAAFGEASQIACAEVLKPELRAIRARLAPLEALVRKIVLIEAAALLGQPEPLRAPSRVRPPRSAARRRACAFRLWPRARPHPARIRQLGPALLVRDAFRERARAELIRRLAAARRMRRPAPERLARRIEALARVLERPRAAIRRLARKLRAAPGLGASLAVARWPRAGADRELQGEVDRHAYFAVRAARADTS